MYQPNKSRSYKNHVCKAVLQFSATGEFIKEWDSIRSASIANGILVGNITNCCKGRCKTAGGFSWKYKDQCDELAHTTNSMVIKRS